jgi:hypothetical protein
MKNSTRDSRKAGTAMVAVLALAIVLPLAVTAVIALSQQQAHMARRVTDQARAKAISEAGINAAYSRIATNFGAVAVAENFPQTAFGGGTYDAFAFSVGPSNAVLGCTGVYRDARASCMVEVQNCPQWDADTNAPSPQSAYGCVITAGGTVTWVGNTDTALSNAWIHGNGAFLGNGANTLWGNVASHARIDMVGGATIGGDAKAPVVSGGTVLGKTIVTDVPLVPIPDIDLTPYYNWALTNGQVYAGSRSISGTVTPAGGVMWVDGDLYLGNGNYTGCFIATGDIELQTTGNGTINMLKVNKYPLLASRDGNITVKQAKMFTFRGLIYCKAGWFDKQGNGDVFGRGAIITAGNFSKNGGWSGILWEDCRPVPPDRNPAAAASDLVVVKAWQE